MSDFWKLATAVVVGGTADAIIVFVVSLIVDLAGGRKSK